MPRSKVMLPEDVVPGCVEVLHERPEYREAFPIADAVDQAVRAGV